MGTVHPDLADTDLTVAPLEVLRRRRSAKWRQYPPDILPLTVAEMDYDLAPAVAAALHEAVDRSDTGYALTTPHLGTALAGFAARRWGWEIDPARVTGVADVGVGVVELLRVLTRPGEPVVISPPVYPPFFGWADEAAARRYEVPLTDAGRLDLDALERAFARHPAVYVLCNPHNPVGRVHSPQELTTLVDLARTHEVTIISDEIHAPLTLPGATFTPLLTVPGAGDVAISVLSASKAFNLAGLKCAAIVTSTPRMAAAVARLVPDLGWRLGHFGALATVAALTDGDAWLDALLGTLDRRRTQLAELLRERLPDIDWHPPEATFLAWLDCTALGADAVETFLGRGKVALDPGAKFGAPGYARLNFATSPAILEQATADMARALRER